MNLSDQSSWPSRLFRSEVCEIARYGPGKLRLEIKAGRMPKPIDRGREDIFDRDAVLRALGMIEHDRPKEEPRWNADPDALRQVRARRLKRAKLERKTKTPVE